MNKSVLSQLSFIQKRNLVWKHLPKALLVQRPEDDLTNTSGTLASGFNGIRIHAEILDSSQGIRSIWHVGAIGEVQSSALGFTAGSAFSPRWGMQQDCKK